MKYIIFDLEWNQCASESEYVLEPICLTGEIIEIGAVRLNEHFVKESELRLFIKPQFYQRLHRKVASLTGIHDRDLQEKGVSFSQAYDRFIEWCGEEFSYMTWSMSDLPILIENMILHGIDCSNLPDTYDLQRIFGREIMRCNRPISLDDALKILNERGDTAHDALNDSNNTALVCQHLDLEEYADEYVTRPYFPKAVRTAYPTFQSVFDDASLLDCKCPICDKPLAFDSWIQFSKYQYASFGKCSEEDEFLMIMSVHELSSSHYRPFCLLYEMSEDLWEIYSTKPEAK